MKTLIIALAIIGLAIFITQHCVENYEVMMYRYIGAVGLTIIAMLQILGAISIVFMLGRIFYYIKDGEYEAN